MPVEEQESATLLQKVEFFWGMSGKDILSNIVNYDDKDIKEALKALTIKQLKDVLECLSADNFNILSQYQLLKSLLEDAVINRQSYCNEMSNNLKSRTKAALEYPFAIEYIIVEKKMHQCLEKSQELLAMNNDEIVDVFNNKLHDKNILLTFYFFWMQHEDKFLIDGFIKRFSNKRVDSLLALFGKASMDKIFLESSSIKEVRNVLYKENSLRIHGLCFDREIDAEDLPLRHVFTALYRNSKMESVMAESSNNYVPQNCDTQQYAKNAQELLSHLKSEEIVELGAMIAVARDSKEYPYWSDEVESGIVAEIELCKKNKDVKLAQNNKDAELAQHNKDEKLFKKLSMAFKFNSNAEVEFKISEKSGVKNSAETKTTTATNSPPKPAISINNQVKRELNNNLQPAQVVSLLFFCAKDSERKKFMYEFIKLINEEYILGILDTLFFVSESPKMRSLYSKDIMRQVIKSLLERHAEKDEELLNKLLVGEKDPLAKADALQIARVLCLALSKQVDRKILIEFGNYIDDEKLLGTIRCLNDEGVLQNCLSEHKLAGELKVLLMRGCQKHKDASNIVRIADLQDKDMKLLLGLLKNNSVKLNKAEPEQIFKVFCYGFCVDMNQQILINFANCISVEKLFRIIKCFYCDNILHDTQIDDITAGKVKDFFASLYKQKIKESGRSKKEQMKKIKELTDLQKENSEKIARRINIYSNPYTIARMFGNYMIEKEEEHFIHEFKKCLDEQTLKEIVKLEDLQDLLKAENVIMLYIDYNKKFLKKDKELNGGLSDEEFANSVSNDWQPQEIIRFIRYKLLKNCPGDAKNFINKLNEETISKIIDIVKCDDNAKYSLKKRKSTLIKFLMTQYTNDMLFVDKLQKCRGKEFVDELKKVDIEQAARVFVITMCEYGNHIAANEFMGYFNKSVLDDLIEFLGNKNKTKDILIEERYINIIRVALQQIQQKVENSDFREFCNKEFYFFDLASHAQKIKQQKCKLQEEHTSVTKELAEESKASDVALKDKEKKLSLDIDIIKITLEILNKALLADDQYEYIKVMLKVLQSRTKLNLGTIKLLREMPDKHAFLDILAYKFILDEKLEEDKQDELTIDEGELIKIAATSAALSEIMSELKKDNKGIDLETFALKYKDDIDNYVKILGRQFAIEQEKLMVEKFRDLMAGMAKGLEDDYVNENLKRDPAQMKKVKEDKEALMIQKKDAEYDAEKLYLDYQNSAKMINIDVAANNLISSVNKGKDVCEIEKAVSLLYEDRSMYIMAKINQLHDKASVMFGVIKKLEAIIKKKDGVAMKSLEENCKRHKILEENRKRHKASVLNMTTKQITRMLCIALEFDDEMRYCAKRFIGYLEEDAVADIVRFCKNCEKSEIAAFYSKELLMNVEDFVMECRLQKNSLQLSTFFLMRENEMLQYIASLDLCSIESLIFSCGWVGKSEQMQEEASLLTEEIKKAIVDRLLFFLESDGWKYAKILSNYKYLRDVLVVFEDCNILEILKPVVQEIMNADESNLPENKNIMKRVINSSDIYSVVCFMLRSGFDRSEKRIVLSSLGCPGLLMVINCFTNDAIETNNEIKNLIQDAKHMLKFLLQKVNKEPQKVNKDMIAYLVFIDVAALVRKESTVLNYLTLEQLEGLHAHISGCDINILDEMNVAPFMRDAINKTVRKKIYQSSDEEIKNVLLATQSKQRLYFLVERGWFRIKAMKKLPVELDKIYYIREELEGNESLSFFDEEDMPQKTENQNINKLINGFLQGNLVAKKEKTSVINTLHANKGVFLKKFDKFCMLDLINEMKSCMEKNEDIKKIMESAVPSDGSLVNYNMEFWAMEDLFVLKQKLDTKLNDEIKKQEDALKFNCKNSAEPDHISKSSIADRDTSYATLIEYNEDNVKNILSLPIGVAHRCIVGIIDDRLQQCIVPEDCRLPRLRQDVLSAFSSKNIKLTRAIIGDARWSVNIRNILNELYNEDSSDEKVKDAMHNYYEGIAGLLKKEYALENMQCFANCNWQYMLGANLVDSQLLLALCKKVGSFVEDSSKFDYEGKSNEEMCCFLSDWLNSLIIKSLTSSGFDIGEEATILKDLIDRVIVDSQSYEIVQSVDSQGYEIVQSVDSQSCEDVYTITDAKFAKKKLHVSESQKVTTTQTKKQTTQNKPQATTTTSTANAAPIATPVAAITVPVVTTKSQKVTTTQTKPQTTQNKPQATATYATIANTVPVVTTKSQKAPTSQTKKQTTATYATIANTVPVVTTKSQKAPTSQTKKQTTQTKKQTTQNKPQATTTTSTANAAPIATPVAAITVPVVTTKSQKATTTQAKPQTTQTKSQTTATYATIANTAPVVTTKSQKAPTSQTKKQTTQTKPQTTATTSTANAAPIATPPAAITSPVVATKSQKAPTSQTKKQTTQTKPQTTAITSTANAAPIATPPAAITSPVVATKSQKAPTSQTKKQTTQTKSQTTAITSTANAAPISTSATDMARYKFRKFVTMLKERNVIGQPTNSTKILMQFECKDVVDMLLDSGVNNNSMLEFVRNLNDGDLMRVIYEFGKVNPIDNSSNLRYKELENILNKKNMELEESVNWMYSFSDPGLEFVNILKENADIVKILNGIVGRYQRLEHASLEGLFEIKAILDEELIARAELLQKDFQVTNSATIINYDSSTPKTLRFSPIGKLHRSLLMVISNKLKYLTGLKYAVDYIVTDEEAGDIIGIFSRGNVAIANSFVPQQEWHVFFASVINVEYEKNPYNACVQKAMYNCCSCIANELYGEYYENAMYYYDVYNWKYMLDADLIDFSLLAYLYDNANMFWGYGNSTPETIRNTLINAALTTDKNMADKLCWVLGHVDTKLMQDIIARNEEYKGFADALLVSRSAAVKDFNASLENRHQASALKKKNHASSSSVNNTNPNNTTTNNSQAVVSAHNSSATTINPDAITATQDNIIRTLASSDLFGVMKLLVNSHVGMAFITSYIQNLTNENLVIAVYEVAKLRLESKNVAFNDKCSSVLRLLFKELQEKVKNNSVESQCLSAQTVLHKLRSVYHGSWGGGLNYSLLHNVLADVFSVDQLLDMSVYLFNLCDKDCKLLDVAEMKELIGDALVLHVIKNKKSIELWLEKYILEESKAVDVGILIDAIPVTQLPSVIKLVWKYRPSSKIKDDFCNKLLQTLFDTTINAICNLPGNSVKKQDECLRQMCKQLDYIMTLQCKIKEVVKKLYKKCPDADLADRDPARKEIGFAQSLYFDITRTYTEKITQNILNIMHKLLNNSNVDTSFLSNIRKNIGTMCEIINKCRGGLREISLGMHRVNFSVNGKLLLEEESQSIKNVVKDCSQTLCKLLKEIVSQQEEDLFQESDGEEEMVSSQISSPEGAQKNYEKQAVHNKAIKSLKDADGKDQQFVSRKLTNINTSAVGGSKNSKMAI